MIPLNEEGAGRNDSPEWGVGRGRRVKNRGEAERGSLSQCFTLERPGQTSEGQEIGLPAAW